MKRKRSVSKLMDQKEMQPLSQNEALLNQHHQRRYPTAASNEFLRQSNRQEWQRVGRRTRFYALLYVYAVAISSVFIIPAVCQECIPPLLPTPMSLSQQGVVVYRVGVLAATSGRHKEDIDFNATFQDYLTATAGARFDPPIRFQVVPLTFPLASSPQLLSEEVDFVYVNPFVFSCIESEFGAQSLVSQVSRRSVGGTVHTLTMFGGVIFARANATNIQTIRHVRGKVVACSSIVDLGSGQMQFREVQQAGLSCINDLKQLVLTFDEQKVVDGVLKGDFDVGFVRTDQLERSLGDDYASFVKVIDPVDNLSIHGVPFPFQSSTPLYPEWNVAALASVPNTVAIEVQQALLALADHAAVGNSIAACYLDNDCERAKDADACKSACEENVDQLSRCDTTVQIALAANTAITNGGHTGFRTTLSYMELRNLQEETMVLTRNNETGQRQCVRLSDAYDAIACPEGQYKKAREDVASGCLDAGLGCKEDFLCFCNPCEEALDFTVFPIESNGTVCSMLEVCETVQQGEKKIFRIFDRKKRDDLDLVVRVLDGTETHELHAHQLFNQLARSVTPTVDSGMYEFAVESNHVGVLLLDILLNGESIPSSPVRVEVEARDCADEFQNLRLEADEEGNCVCSVNSIAMGGKCVPTGVVLTVIVLPVVAFIVFGVCYLIRRLGKKADSVWLVRKSDLHFDNPPKILGRGAFGLVVLAEYRGTQVAVKRVIPPRNKTMMHSRRDTEGTSTLLANRSPTDLDLEHGATSLDSEEQSSLGEPTRIYRRHTLGGPIPTFAKTKTDAATPETEEDGERRRKSFEEASFKEFDFENENQAADKAKTEVSIAPVSSGAVKSEAPGNLLQSCSGRGLYRLLTWSGRDEYSRLKADFIAEMRHLSKLRHPSVTTVIGAVLPRAQEPMLVMEYMEMGSLYDILHNDTLLLDGELVLPMLRDISMGMRFLHAASPPVIHGCLNSTNVLVDSKFRAKICDLAILQKELDHSAAFDVYSFGIILHEVYSRQETYRGGDLNAVSAEVANWSKEDTRPRVPPSCPPLVASLMSDCLVSEPSDRPTFEDLDVRIKGLHVSSVEPSNIRRSWQTKKEHRNSDLLNDVFPKHVAEALREGRKVEPETRNCVTIFFSDIVGFTDLSSTMSPIKVSDMLDRLYLKFDLLSHRHDVFKVETIGDAYMAATNLVKDQDDHVKRIAEFAIEALEAACETLVDENDKSKGTVKIRVGFHSGPVVASVVGSRCPRYSLFGDTVNVAARMESTSKTNRIQCSDDSAMILQSLHPEIRVASRGPIKVKGKGEIHTFWVNEDAVLEHAPSHLVHSDKSFRTPTEKRFHVEGKRLAHSL